MKNLDLQNNQQDALEEKLVQINRVAKTVKGGRVMSFTALTVCLLYTSPSPRDKHRSRMPSSA